MAAEAGWRNLVERTAKGDAEALRALYRRTHRPAFTFLMRITCSAEIAEELMLELYGDLRRHASRYRGESMVLPWLMNRARALAIARLRRDQSLNRNERASDPSLITIEMPDYRNILKLREQSRVLRNVIASLADDERRALEAIHLDGLSHDEAAKRLACSAGEVAARTRQGLEKLERAFAPASVPFSAWPTDVLRPPESLHERIFDGAKMERTWVEPDWASVAPGIACKVLAEDTENHMVSMLVRLDPSGEYPPHTHAAVEELHLLHGELWIDERKLYPGDYNVAPPGTGDKRVWSQTGCTCVLTTSTRDALG